jgi:iron complex outermembrane recepter protein
VAQGAYALINARMSYLFPSGRFEVALFGTNLADEQYLEHGVFPAAFGPAIGVSGRPRELGATAKFRF